MGKLFCAMLLLLMPLTSLAAIYVQQNGAITAVASGNSSSPATESFSIKVSKNLGNCVAGDWITFSKSDFGANEEGYKLAYSLALAALAKGSTNVSIYNALTNSCSKGTWILVEE